jgi:hypothetical protein
MKGFFVAVVFVLWSTQLVGCNAIKMHAELTPVGALDLPRSQVPIVPSAADVQVFYSSAPAGFTLRNNELQVETGYGHRIVGIIKLQRDQGGRTCTLIQRDAMEALRQGAYLNGGNAVVYATSTLGQADNPTACMQAAKISDFGSGWAVVLSAAPSATPDATAPVAPNGAVVPAPAPAAAPTH